MTGRAAVVVQIDAVGNGRPDEAEHLCALVPDGVTIVGHRARDTEINAEACPQALDAGRDAVTLEDRIETGVKAVGHPEEVLVEAGLLVAVTAASPAATATGWPLYVPLCWQSPSGMRRSMTSRRPPKTLSGWPPPTALPSVHRSGVTPRYSWAPPGAMRKADSTSSKISRTPWSRVSPRRAARNPGVGMTQPAL